MSLSSSMAPFMKCWQSKWRKVPLSLCLLEIFFASKLFCFDHTPNQSPIQCPISTNNCNRLTSHGESKDCTVSSRPYLLLLSFRCAHWNGPKHRCRSQSEASETVCIAIKTYWKENRLGQMSFFVSKARFAIYSLFLNKPSIKFKYF